MADQLKRIADKLDGGDPNVGKPTEEGNLKRIADYIVENGIGGGGSGGANGVVYINIDQNGAFIDFQDVDFDGLEYIKGIIAEGKYPVIVLHDDVTTATFYLQLSTKGFMTDENIKFVGFPLRWETNGVASMIVFSHENNQWYIYKYKFTCENADV